MADLFDSAKVVFRYTRPMAMADDVLVDATQNRFGRRYRASTSRLIISR